MVVNSLMATKLVGMTILGSVSIVCGMIPILISKKLGWTRSSGSGADSLSPFARSLLSGILCFGGGILMGTVLYSLLLYYSDKYFHNIYILKRVSYTCCQKFMKDGRLTQKRII